MIIYSNPYNRFVIYNIFIFITTGAPYRRFQDRKRVRFFVVNV